MLGSDFKSALGRECQPTRFRDHVLQIDGAEGFTFRQRDLEFDGELVEEVSFFHTRASWQMTRAGKLPRNPVSSCFYLPGIEAQEEVGLHTIAHYMQVQC